jgi:ribosome-binding ATPase YchF (GTP1/OBG family)
MSGKLGSDAFGYYVALGDDRSYSAVASHFEVSKRAVVKAAAREDWASRLQEIDQEAREKADQKLGETLSEMRSRHQKLLRAMSTRAANALRAYPLTSGMEAMKAAEMVIKLERLILGEPSQRSTLSVEQVTRREVESLLAVEDGEAGDEDEW